MKWRPTGFGSPGQRSCAAFSERTANTLPSVSFLKPPPAKYGNAHRAEVSGTIVPIVHRVAFLGTVAGAFEVNRVIPGLAARTQGVTIPVACTPATY
jgi:hypothetical protein